MRLDVHAGQENHIRFKNLLREAETRLTEAGATGMDKALESAYRLLRDRPFWHHQCDGMALFMSRDLFKPYRLPIDLEELVIIADRFHVKPMLPLLTGDGRFYLLALSQNEVRLFQCTRNSVSPVELDGVPLSLEEAMKYDEQQKQLQFHTGTAGTGGKRPGMFHGQGVGIDDAKDQILRFFQGLTKGVAKAIPDPRAPLVIAAVDFLVPIFREASDYPTIVDEIVPGNPEGILPQELHERAAAIVDPYFQREMLEHLDLYGHLVGTGKTANRIEEVVRAAYQGRVSTLFVAVGVQRWGTYDPSNDEILLKKSDKEAGWDLLDFAAVRTLANGGTVYAVNREEMPDHSPVAAIFRY